MGIVFGITGTRGPEYAVLFRSTGYELRKYPGYVTAEVAMTDDKAKYIGVFGNPENTAVQSMDMTHPVILDNDDKGQSKSKNKGQAMAMTHPVIFDNDPKSRTNNDCTSGDTGSGSNKGKGQSLAMTSPVINNKNIMKFVLPSTFQKISQAPKPTDKRVVIKEVSEHYIAVSGFSGWYTPQAGAYQLKKLIKMLKNDNFLVSKSSATKQPVTAKAAISSSSSSSSSDTKQSTNQLKAIENDDEIINSLMNEVDWQVAQYHPPFTLPFCRLNEIWVTLTPQSSPALNRLLQESESQSSQSAAAVVASSSVGTTTSAD